MAHKTLHQLVLPPTTFLLTHAVLHMLVSWQLPEHAEHTLPQRPLSLSPVLKRSFPRPLQGLLPPPSGLRSNIVFTGEDLLTTPCKIATALPTTDGPLTLRYFSPKHLWPVCCFRIQALRCQGPGLAPLLFLSCLEDMTEAM